ncbi:AMIN domain-containing protein [bacterium]|nr:AMIN domain-containing protein [bacterium]MBU1600013.1 AMIN domain-containing protein [bacterium]MBU2462286.1 AMIN domain-containing protein [bacterium]
MKKIVLVTIFGLFGRDAFGYQISGVRAYDEEQKTFISILASEQPQYRVFTIDKPARLIIDLLNAEGKVTEVKNESKAVLSIEVSQRMNEPAKIARVSIELSRLFPYQILTDSKKVVLQIETGVKPVEKIEPPKEEILTEIPPSSALPPLGKIEEAIIHRELVVEKEQEVATISLKFKDVDLRDALSAIAKKIKRDIVIGESVEGNVTMELNDLSWKKAFDIITKMHNYEWVEEGNVIRVDTRENLIRTALCTEIVSVSYDKVENMALLVTPMLDPDAGGKLTADKRTNSLIINTTLSNLKQIKEVIKRLDAPTPQVMIEVQMVGISEDPQRALGFQWGLANQVGYSFGGYDTGGELKAIEVGLGSGGQNKLTIGHIMDTKRLFFAISDLVTKQKANIIASPRIATSDNQPAKITIGDSIPYMEEVPGGEGGPAIKASFMDVMTKLNITPRVNPDNSINLDIDVSDKTGELKRVQFRGIFFDAPSTAEMNIKTQILVNDGETVVIGGLIQRSDKIVETSVPFLADFPFIGQFFRHTTVGRATSKPMKQEILIFITPHIINR